MNKECSKVGNSDNTTINHYLDNTTEIYHKMEEQESKHKREKTLKHSHRSNRYNDSLNKESLNIEYNKNVKKTGRTEHGKIKSRSGEQLKLEFCSRHEIESITQSSTRTHILPKELMESIRRLPSEIDKTNAFITESISSRGECDKLKNTSKPIISVNGNKSRHKLVTPKNKIWKDRKSEQMDILYPGIEANKETKRKISSYLQSFVTKPLGESLEVPAKFKSHSSTKANKTKSTKKYTPTKTHNKSLSPLLRGDSKHNLRTDYIEWLMTENKFFTEIDSSSFNSSKTSKTDLTVTENETAVDIFNTKKKEEKRKRPKKLHNHKKKKKLDMTPTENGIMITTKSSSDNTQHPKNCQLIFNEIMSNKSFSVDQLHHIRWLASVENIIKIKSKEFIRRTISLNELYSYIPTHDGDKIENFLEPNHDHTECFKNMENNKLICFNNQYLEDTKKTVSECKTELYSATIENDFAKVFRQSHTEYTDYEGTTDVKDSTESVESVSIAIKKTNNIFDSCGSFNIEIFHNGEDLCSSGQLKEHNQDLSYYNKASSSPNNVSNNNNNYLFEDSQSTSNLTCPVFKTLTNVLPNTYKMTESINYNNLDNLFKPPTNVLPNTYKMTESINYNNLENDFRTIKNPSNIILQSPKSIQKVQSDNYNPINYRYNNSGMNTNINYSRENARTQSNKQITYNKNDNFNPPYIKVGEQRALVNNSKSIQLSDKNSEFSRLINSAQMNLYDKNSNNRYGKEAEQNDIKFTYNDSNHSYTENTEGMNIENKYSAQSSSSKNDEKQNEILLVMTELSQKINFIQEQISYMNINCNKYENIEVMLMKLKNDVSFGLKHVETKLKEIEHSNKLEPKSETIIKNENKQPKVTKSLNNIMIKPIEMYQGDDDDLILTECFEVSGKEHKTFYDALGNLTNQLKLLTAKQEKQDEKLSLKLNIKSKEVGLMTEESPSLCNYCCIYVKTNLDKPTISLCEKETQCDLRDSSDVVFQNLSKKTSEFLTENVCSTISDITLNEVHLNQEYNAIEIKELRRNEDKSSRTKNKKSRKYKSKQCFIL